MTFWLLKYHIDGPVFGPAILEDRCRRLAECRFLIAVVKHLSDPTELFAVILVYMRI